MRPAARSPDYWFPRAMAWPTPETTAAHAAHALGPGGGTRVHAIEYAWLDAMRTVKLYARRLCNATPRRDSGPDGPVQ